MSQCLPSQLGTIQLLYTEYCVRCCEEAGEESIVKHNLGSALETSNYVTQVSDGAHLAYLEDKVEDESTNATWCEF